MQVEEESPKQYVDIARAPDKEMRPERPVSLGLGPGRVPIAPSRAGCGQGHAEGGAVPARLRVGATPQRAKRAGLNPRALARLCGRIPADGAPAQRSGAPSALFHGLTLST